MSWKLRAYRGWGSILLNVHFSPFFFRENFYTLAWTTLDLGGEKSNVLVSGGIRGEVRMFHPKHKVCFYEWRPVDKKNIAVNSLVFHSEKPTWLFCELLTNAAFRTFRYFIASKSVDRRFFCCSEASIPGL